MLSECEQEIVGPAGQLLTDSYLLTSIEDVRSAVNRASRYITARNPLVLLSFLSRMARWMARRLFRASVSIG